MVEASITEMGQCPTREIAVADQRRTVLLNADLKLRFQEISRAAAENKIGPIEAQRQICVAVYGRTFWESIPFEMADAFSEPASDIYFDIFGIERPSKAEIDEDEGEADAEEAGKNVVAPPVE